MSGLLAMKSYCYVWLQKPIITLYHTNGMCSTTETHAAAQSRSCGALITTIIIIIIIMIIQLI